jgi:PAS domain S-box-containing protein
MTKLSGTDIGSIPMNIVPDNTKKSQMSLPATAKEEAMMAQAFEHSSNAMMITNPKHEIQIANKAFLEWFEFTLEEVLGQHAGMLLKSKSQIGAQLSVQIPQSLETRGEWHGEILHQSKNGMERPCLLSITSIYSNEGEKIGYVSVNIDLTERKKLEAQLMQGEKLSNIGESVATLMHEIRNPLAGIAMNVFMLESREEKCKTENCKYSNGGELESIQLISKEVKRLEALVKNALDYARNTQIHPENVTLENFLDEVKKMALSHSAKNSVAILMAAIPEDFSAFFDPDLMKQVFLNLLQNAIDAASLSSDRVVRIGARIAEHPKWRYISASSKVLLINVDNSGAPISEQHVLNLFKPFFTSKAEGIGLGLATASKIVRMHYGILGHYQIDDAPFFTRFTVALPI